MGIYTEFRSEFFLRADTPERAIKAIRWLTGLLEDLGEDWTKCPFKDDHKFFTLDRHHQIGSHYSSPPNWDGNTWDDTSLQVAGQSWTRCERRPDGTWAVVVSASCKNYDRQIEEFHRWISQFLINQTKHVVGVYLYEEDHSPSPIYSDGEVERQPPDDYADWR